LAKELSKKERQQALEDLLVGVMETTQKEYKAFIEDFSERLEGKLNEIIILKTSQDQRITSNLIAYQRAIMELYELLEDYREEFRRLLQSTFADVFSQASGHTYYDKVENTIEDTGTFQNNIEEAYDYFEEIFDSILVEMDAIDSSSLSDKSTNELVATLASIRDRLVYFLRRHVEAQMSLIINLAIIEASRQLGTTYWKWCIRPELTASGTCERCRGISEGGIGDEGIYALEDLPLLPVHPHCVCVVIPVVL
jgi:hypothetical protein